MSMEIIIEPLTAKAFAPFGEILEAAGTPDKIINQGMCGRHHDLATLDFVNGRAGISIFDAQVRSLPYELIMMERHPEGSQAFVPMSYFPFRSLLREMRTALQASRVPFYRMRVRASIFTATHGMVF